MKDVRITVRLAAEELENLKDFAQRMNMPTVALARICIRDWLIGYDQKHEALVDRFNDLAALVERGSVLSAAAIASAAMLEANKIQQGVAESEEVYVARYRAMLKEHITGAVGAGIDLHRAVVDGKIEI